MIELLAVQAITTAALAAVVIKLRRELWPAIATAGPFHIGFWIRSIDVMALETPQFEASKTVIRIRWLFSEELFLIHRLRFYDVPMLPGTRHRYVKWKAWMQGDDRYKCEVEKPRGLSRLYNKAIDVFCREVKKEEPPKEVIILPSKVRKRMYKRMLRQLREDAARRNSAET